MHLLRVLPGAVAATAVAGVGYSLIEARSPRLRRLSVGLLPPGQPSLRILHLSDLHVRPGQDWKIRWLRGLARLAPDLVVDTGDNLAARDALPATLAALELLLDFPGVFVGGSNDYFAPVPRNPLRYLLADSGRRVHGQRLAWGELRAAFCERGWRDLTNRRERLRIGELLLDAAGVNDPHLSADRYRKVAGRVAEDADLGLGLVHAPEPRVLDRFAADGFELLMSGHTHGGQVRLPGHGALVTNCGLDPARARGLSRWSPETFLHVSAGVGTNPYTPIRFACPPEATLLTVRPRDYAS
ncbi:MAG: metallophosphoesterase [Mycobacteriales bacterium]